MYWQLLCHLFEIMLKLFFRHDTKKIFISDSVNLSVVNFKLNKLFNISRNKKTKWNHSRKTLWLNIIMNFFYNIKYQFLEILLTCENELFVSYVPKMRFCKFLKDVCNISIIKF